MFGGCLQVAPGLIVVQIGLPKSALYVIGILLGVDLTTIGVAHLVVGVTGYRLANERLSAAGDTATGECNISNA